MVVHKQQQQLHQGGAGKPRELRPSLIWHSSHQLRLLHN
jgi:hypothetical protein